MRAGSGRQDPSSPVFTMSNGDLVTTGYINSVLDTLLKEESPKITAKAFRPVLATILAQQGATPEELKGGNPRKAEGSGKMDQQGIQSVYK